MKSIDEQLYGFSSELDLSTESDGTTCFCVDKGTKYVSLGGIWYEQDGSYWKVGGASDDDLSGYTRYMPSAVGQEDLTCFNAVDTGVRYIAYSGHWFAQPIPWSDDSVIIAAEAQPLENITPGDISWDDSTVYSEGSIGAELQDVEDDVADVANDLANLDSGDIPYDDEETYPSSSVGWQVSNLKSQINEIEAGFPQKSASGSIVTIDDGADNVPVVSLTAQIVPVQSGSGDPAPNNVRPISGWTGAQIHVTGKNLLPSNRTAYSSSSAYIYIPAIMPPDTLATMSLTDKNTSVDVSGCYLGFAADYDGTVNPTEYRWVINNGSVMNEKRNISQVGSLTKLCQGIIIYPSTDEVFNKLFSRFNIQVEFGYPASTFAPYADNTVSITFPDSAGTVYGGTLVLNQDGTADLTVTHAEADFGDLDWFYSEWTVNYFGAFVPGRSHNAFNVFSSLYPTATTEQVAAMGDKKIVGSSTTDHVFLRDSSYTDAATFKAAMAGVQLVYELATPQTYHIEDVELVKTLYGLNNIWADAGDISLVYRADPATFTSEQIRIMLNAMVAPVEQSTTASKAYSVNDFLILDNVLYKVISPISNGGTITIDTNVSATTIGEQITAILNT